MTKVVVAVVFGQREWAFQFSPQRPCANILQPSRDVFGLRCYKVTDLELRDAEGLLVDVTSTIQNASKTHRQPFEIRVREDTAIHFKLLYKHKGQSYWHDDTVVRNNHDLAVILGNRNSYLVPIDVDGVPIVATQIRSYLSLDDAIPMYERCDDFDWPEKVAKFASFVNAEGSAAELSIVEGFVDWIKKSTEDLMVLLNGVHVHGDFPEDELVLVHGDSSSSPFGFECNKIAPAKHEFQGFVFDKREKIVYLVVVKHAMIESCVQEHENKLKECAKWLKKGKMMIEENGERVLLSEISQVKGVVGGRFFPIRAKYLAQRARFVCIIVSGKDFSVDCNAIGQSLNYLS